MSNRYHYNRHGGYEGHSSNTPPQTINIAPLIVFSLMCWGGYYLWEIIGDWRSYDSPYKQIAAFYNYTIVAIVKGGVFVFNYLMDNDLTSYKNFNFVMGIILAPLGSLLYISFVLAPINLISEKFNMHYLGILIIYLIPAFFLLIWALFAFIFGWLFA